jgi:hypothetical protein
LEAARGLKRPLNAIRMNIKRLLSHEVEIDMMLLVVTNIKK